ncbi:MAG: hypothetical protein AAGG68_22605 [Bacteroidota bacterium]
MANQTKIKYALLAEWLRSLEAEGYSFGVDKRLQFQELLNRLPEETTLAELKLLLTPLIAHNEQEQNLVYSVFERARKRVEAIHRVEQEREYETAPTKKSWTLNVLIGLLALLTIPLAIFLWNPDVATTTEVHATKFFGTHPLTTDTVCLDSSNLAIYEKISLPIQQVFLCESQSQADSSIFGNYRIEQNLCLIYSAKDSLGQDSICVKFIDSKLDTFLAYFRPTIEQKIVIDTTDVAPIASNEFSATYETYPIQSDIHSLQIEPLTWVEEFYVNNKWWLKLLFYLLSAVITLLILLVRERNRRQLVAEIQSNDQAPNIWNIETGETPNIQLEKEYDLLLNNLRQRTTADQRVFDVPKTIQSTIDKAGMTNFQYRFRTRPPEYLLLINQRSRDNHRARWYDYLYHFFLENEVLVDRFFYDEDPRLCWNETYVDGLKLKDLQQLHPEARLMMVGSGYSLLNPLTGKAAKWTKVFNLWKERAIFSPTPTADWGRKERLLEQKFIMLPATRQALQFYVSQLELGSEAEFGNWKNQVEDAHEYSIKIKPKVGNIPMQLNIHYDESVVKWIAACAVYPSLHWDLTMRLGDLLSEGEHSLLNSENISNLCHLSWFTEGEIPPKIRVNLLEWLENEHPETLEKVRTELHDLFQQNPPPKDSIAWEEYHLNSSFNEWLITTDNKRKKQLEVEIAQDIAKGTEPDFTVIKYLDRPKSPLDFVVPDAWKEHVYNGGFSGLGFKGLGTDIFWAIPIWLLVCFLVWFIEPQVSQQCEGEFAIADLAEVEDRLVVHYSTGIDDFNEEDYEKSYRYTTEQLGGSIIGPLDLCIDEPADRILLGEFATRFHLVNQQYDIIDSATSIVNDIFNIIDGDYYPDSKHLADSFLNNYHKNLSVDYWNYAIPNYQLHDSLRVVSDDYYQQFQQSGIDSLLQLANENDEFARVAKDSACFFFERAWRLDSLNENRIAAKVWCQERSYDIRVEIASGQQLGLAADIRELLGGREGYQFKDVKTEPSIRTSEIIYFYEEDRFIANALLIEGRGILLDTDLKIRKETPPFGPGDPLKGEIIIRVAQQEIPAPPAPTPPSNEPKPFTVDFYALGQSQTLYQEILTTLLEQDYTLGNTSLTNNGYIDANSIAYYSSDGAEEARALAKILQDRNGLTFEVVRGVDSQRSESRYLKINYYMEEALIDNSRFPIASRLINRLTARPSITLNWVNPQESSVDVNEDQYAIQLGVFSNQSLNVGNMWIEQNGRVLKNGGDSNQADRNYDSKQQSTLRYNYDYKRTIDLVEGNNVLKFLIINEKKEVVKESSTVIIKKTKRQELPNNILTRPSIDLYFDNDQPSGKSTASYDELYEQYMRKRGVYKKENYSISKKDKKTETKIKVDDFFEQELKANYQYFQQILSQVQSYLEQGYEMQICLQVTTPTEGISNSNFLVISRIQSITRSIQEYNNGALADYYQSGALIVQELPAVGREIEVKAQGENSKKNDRDNIERSAYDLFLAQERKVSIVSVGRKDANCTD